jgi:hypothetical protein
MKLQCRSRMFSRPLGMTLVATIALGCGAGADGANHDASTASPSSGGAIAAAGMAAAAAGAAGNRVVPAEAAAAGAGPSIVPNSPLGAAGLAANTQGVGGRESAGAGGALSAAAGFGGANAGSAGVAGAGGAGAGGAAGHPEHADAGDPCGADAQMVTGTTRAQGSGDTDFQTSGSVEIVSVSTTMKVPSKPSPSRGTLFLWPGLQPLQMDMTVGYGVLQPVLAWGSSCAPGAPSTFDSWWISGQYVGTTPGSWTNITCEGGDVMKVDVGDELDITMTLTGTVWTEVITNKSNGKSVNFMRDLKGQKEQWLINSIELKDSTKPVDDVIFTSMVIKLSASQPKACVPNVKGTTDYFAPPRASADGKTCCISKLILRASGVKASSPDTP